MAKILVGLDQFHYAVCNSDTTAGVSYQTPVTLKGAISVAYDPNSEVATLFADDGPFDTAESIGEIQLDIGVADISQEDYATLMGHTITGGVLDEAASDQPVDIAFGFRAKRSNGGYSYVWVLKGKLSKPSTDHQTKANGINFQTPMLRGKFTQRVYDGLFKKSTRDDADDYTAAIGSAWFSSVYGTTADTTNPTFTATDPSASATSASQTTDITITFSENILSSTVTAANFMLVGATSSVTYTAAISFSGSDTVTLTPPASLTSSATYNVIITTGVKDEAGNALSSTQTYWFQTT